MPKTRLSFTCPGASAVYVAGDFNNWDPQARRMKRLSKADDTFVAVLDLEPGCYQYKFIVDGEWRCGDGPCVPNEHGTDNNLLEVCA
jgi:1,4-alpha-glucan branching enzyme